MSRFETEDARRLRYMIWIGGICLALVMLINSVGCSSLSIARQKKMAMLMGQQIELVGNEVLVRCNDGTLKQEDCDLMADTINLALDAQNAYVKALIAMQEGVGSKEQVQKALGALQTEMASLIGNAVRLGVKIRKE